MLVGERGPVRVEHSVDEHQLRYRLVSEDRGGGSVIRKALTALPIDVRQWHERGVLPLFETRGRPSEGVETLRRLRTDAAHALRLAVDVSRLDRGAIFENAAHRAAATSSSIHS